MTISRTRFYKWVAAYASFSQGVEPEVGKDRNGKWIRIRRKHELELDTKFDF